MNHSIRIKPFQLLFLLIFGVSTLQAQDKPFRIVGYVPSWGDVASLTQSFDFKQVTHINYAFQNPDASGNLVGSNLGLPALVTKAHANNVKVLVSIGGGSAADGIIKDYFLNLISTADKRAAFIHKIALYLKGYKLDGLDVDEEGPAINSNYGAFIKQLADSLKPKGYLLTTAVGWGNEKILNTTLPLFDYMALMAYDYTGDWNQTRPGQHAPYWYAQQMINDFVKRGVKKENLCLGLPFYGYGFYKLPGSYNYNTILTKYPNAWQTDQVGDTIYYNGMNTIWKKTKLALAQTSGVMIWELSNEVKGERSLLRVINLTVDSMSVSASASLLRDKGFKIYPNPANDHLIIETPNSLSLGRVNILTINGSIVQTLSLQPAGGTESQVNISGLTRGEYICQVTSGDGIFAKLFVKE
ncbi:MAG TPA: glycosyl hydrolase family 18 protein [Prolixibacteraceae bacterium]|jgi:GH18 family chitinase